MRVLCEIEETVLENDSGSEIDSVEATCARCQHKTESFGNEEASIKRCLALMREECPRGEANFYIADGP